MTFDPLWTIVEERFQRDHQNHAETIFTIGNGYLGTRGALEEGLPGDRRTTFLHGVFDDIPVSFTELANAPDWLELYILLDGERFSLAAGEVLDYTRQLDLRSGLLTRKLIWKSPQGRTTRLEFNRFASLADPHAVVLRASVTPMDYAGLVEFRAGLNGETDNENFKHWQWLNQTTASDRLTLNSRTRASQVELAQAARLTILAPADVQRESWDVHNHPTLVGRTQLQAGQSATAEKLVIFYTSRDNREPLTAANTHLDQLPAPAWDALWEPNRSAWDKEWQTCDVIIEGDDEAQIAVRFSLFQLLVAAPRKDEHVSIGAKTLSGFGYRGHAFWDTEVFMLPFFTYTQPEIARNLLSYRFHNLEGARKKARGNGFNGAQFPWESAATGEEVTPSWVPHFADRSKMVRIWTGDIEIHISAMIPFALCQYWAATGDDAFMIDRGAEIFIETARFWSSRAEWNKQAGRYEFRDVIGPDEYHEHVDNNAFTNAFARWTLQSAIRLLDWVEKKDSAAYAALKSRLDLKPAELRQWSQVAELIYFPYDKETGLIEQFEGYFARRDIDLAALEPRTESMQVILGIEGANLAQILKQPDVVMLAYMLPALFDERSLRANYDYYTARTDHTYGSSLGPSIQAIMSCKLGLQEDAYEHFMRAARADLRDVRGNAGDGIHGASAGGIWQALAFGFGGLTVTTDGWTVKPHLPKHWKRLVFRFTWRGKSYVIDLPEKGPFRLEEA
ncbi:MAG: glycoside hydrolase family 65 protein [Anaerolineae bacterium]|nr:glycoside hydrolase family 65 protein [Anaerolineae bacterium]